MKTVTDKIVSVLVKHRWILSCLVLLSCSLSLTGQVTIIVPTGSFQYSLQDLSQTQIDNVSSQTIYNCYAVITCTDGNGNKVFEMKTPNSTLAPGTNYLGYTSLTNAITIGGGQNFNTFQQTGTFPPGNYIICVTEYSNGGAKILGTACSSITASDFGNLYLLSPQDEAIIETEYPTFDWMTFSSRKLDAVITYSLRVCLLQSGQTYGEAIVGNPPLVYQQNLTSNSFNYPSSAPLLDTSQRYVWQVEANITIGNNAPKQVYSEIWMFQFGHHTPDHKKKKKEDQKQYPYLAKSAPAGLYVFNKYLNFRYNNECRDSLLHYNIYKAGQQKPVFTNKQLPITLKPRVNYISLALPKGMIQESKTDKPPLYTLEVSDSRKGNWQMKFSIIENKKSKKKR